MFGRGDEVTPMTTGELVSVLSRVNSRAQTVYITWEHVTCEPYCPRISPTKPEKPPIDFIPQKTTMVDPVPRVLKIEDIDGLGKGSFAQVGLVKSSDYVVKIASNDARQHHAREKEAYQRLGRQRLTRVIFSWLYQAVEAVRYIHSHNIIHGDLGCHNFLVKGDGNLVLYDFGGSRIDGSDCLELPPTRYSIPKTIRDNLQPTRQDDLFALGTIMYEISTGRLLWEDLDDEEIEVRFINERYPSFTDVSDTVKAIIIQCWTGKHMNVDEVAIDLGLFPFLSTSSPRILGLSLFVGVAELTVTSREGIEPFHWSRQDKFIAEQRATS
ncbi:kinase-like protein [Sodiomyces alkalinus F11]|uniref:Kinase-like protein n=1 Tax=Sodiomyces alkalinus (strain CBS 110278 / VKM F-3762 / F11) TaxID=1314773 RepID=A0A3N2Q8Z7_SODAK|nr:kinase-like protein [Sodiomyces alkalinus F11]ROT43261.1 kinase-like protein [Sodiomyces alkalinus F11]